MKKVLSLVLVLIFALSLTACGGVDKSERILYKDADLLKTLELGEYKGIKVDTSSDEFKKFYDAVVASDVEENNLYVQKKEGKVEKGDIANIDYVGKKDGVAFEGGTASGYDLEIGSGSFIEGFEDGLIGVEIGKTVDLNLKFPENYGNEELNGAAVVFTVKVNYVTTDEARKAEDYYKELDFASVEDYNADVKERAVKDYLVENISKNSKIKEYPEKDVEKLYTSTKNSIETNLKSSYGMDFTSYLSAIGQTEEQFKKSAVDEQIKPLMDTQMVMYAILDNEKIAVTKKDTDAQLKKIIAEIGNSEVKEEDVKSFYGDYYFETLSVTEKAEEILYKNAKIS